MTDLSHSGTPLQLFVLPRTTRESVLEKTTNNAVTPSSSDAWLQERLASRSWVVSTRK